jgi:spermidine synthase
MTGSCPMVPRRYIHFAVIVSGGCTLAVEILGVRLVSPFYGAGLYLWSALASVTLGALSLGYALGGRWADRGPALRRFAALLGGAGLWIALIPWILHPVLAATESIDLRGAVLATALVLFFPPFALLGMAIPYAVRLETTSLDSIGRTSGRLYALSTLAGAAAVGTAGALIPAVGAGRAAFLVGATLIVTALIGAALERGKTIHKIVMIAASFAAAILAVPGGRHDKEAGLISVAESPYAEVRVVDVDDRRLMLVDGIVRTEVDAQTMGAQSPYVEVLDMARGFYKAPGNMLLVGLSGGSVAKRFAANGWSVDVVEIDPAVTRTSIEYFGLKPADAHVYPMDAREFLMEHEEAYDLIIVDAFGGGRFPFHLVTREAFVRFKARLSSEGVIALNVTAVGWRDTLVASLAATLSREFSNVIVLPMPEPPDELGNMILLASNRELELREEPVPWDRFSPEYHMAHAWDNRFTVDPAGARVITDNLNPVDLWADRIDLTQRKELRER